MGVWGHLISMSFLTPLGAAEEGRVSYHWPYVHSYYSQMQVEISAAFPLRHAIKIFHSAATVHIGCREEQYKIWQHGFSGTPSRREQAAGRCGIGAGMPFVARPAALCPGKATCQPRDFRVVPSLGLHVLDL